MSIPKSLNGKRHVLEDQISRILSEKLHLDVHSSEVDLFETGVVDSMALVSLLASLEEKFGISVLLEDLEIDHFRSISRIAEFVEQRRHDP